MSIHKQLVLHGLPLPTDIINLIKDFTFMCFIMANAKKRKDVIIRLINSTIWCGRARPDDEYISITLFWIEEDTQCSQFYQKYCKNCGNFCDSHNYMDIINNIKCICN
jgi:hypothetical protein